MSGSSNSVITRVVDRVFPRMPDFFGLLNEQCDLAVEAMEVFVEFMESGDPEKALQVREFEHAGDRLKDRNLDVLNRAFATPMDREDIYRAIMGIDHVVNYAKTTVRELETLELTPDKYMLELAVQLKTGAEALQRGFAKLASDPASAEADAAAARKAERNVEKAYRRALAELFNVGEVVERLESNVPGSKVEAMNAVINVFKRREVYRHLSNAADRLAGAGQVLRDIVVKIS
jgi:uncharacterized protein Yka (UPF0111/DUF47 family)